MSLALEYALFAEERGSFVILARQSGPASMGDVQTSLPPRQVLPHSFIAGNEAAGLPVDIIRRR